MPAGMPAFHSQDGNLQITQLFDLGAMPIYAFAPLRPDNGIHPP
jgi:hypothetical protein